VGSVTEDPRLFGFVIERRQPDADVGRRLSGNDARRRRVLKPLLLALALDMLVGEFPEKLHPVVWMGRMLDWLQARSPQGEPARLVYGVGVALGLPIGWGVLGRLVESFAPWPVQAGARKPAFAGRSLLDAARRVENDLAEGDLEKARGHLRWLVSRPATTLDGGLVAAAAIESLAENFVDSWLAPLAAYSLFGLGGAYAYRAANTADAMWGYRTPEFECLGKAAARLDDVLNWIPARVGALVLIAVGRRSGRAWDIWRRDGSLTGSPNAGQTMATAAGHLNVRLEKVGYYVLHAEARVPAARDIGAARRLVARAMLAAAALSLGVRKLVRL
jgi:adenosylcobinamide-phosphate synthase